MSVPGAGAPLMVTPAPVASRMRAGSVPAATLPSLEAVALDGRLALLADVASGLDRAPGLARRVLGIALELVDTGATEPGGRVPLVVLERLAEVVEGVDEVTLRDERLAARRERVGIGGVELDGPVEVGERVSDAPGQEPGAAPRDEGARVVRGERHGLGRVGERARVVATARTRAGAQDPGVEEARIELD